jgi:hypothetical protein
MQKYQSTVRNLFCNFCKSVGHEEKDCCAFDLMRECTADAYRVQGEESEGGALSSLILPEEVIIKEEEEASEAVEEEALVEEEDLLYVIIVIILDIW